MDEKGGPSQAVASLAAEKASHPRQTLLTLRCASCQAALGSVRRSSRGLLFIGRVATSPKEMGLLKFKESGRATGARWQKGVVGEVVDLIDQHLGPHPELQMKCRGHGKAVVEPDEIRSAVAGRKKVLVVHPSAVPPE
ncbi:MAG TPA: hypothetical protein VNT56_11945 [Acidimicrobiales bacterium]|nr:hypothetical protein [Acidimicrobiales bacterium]